MTRVETFFQKISRDNADLSMKTGIPRRRLADYGKRDHIPAVYLVIFCVEAVIAKTTPPLGCFGLYRPQEGRMKLALRQQAGSIAQFLRMLGVHNDRR